MRSQHPFSRRFFPFLFVLVLFVAACGPQTTATPSATPTPRAAKDFYGTPIVFPTSAPQRIVSLIPSISEDLGALGLTKRVIAVDFYTNFPSDMAALPKVSDANGKYSIEQIVSLKPDLVLSYGGSTKQYDSQLAGLGLHVIDLPIANFSQSLQQILLIGQLTSTQAAATKLVNQLQQEIDAVKTAVAGTTAPKVLIELDDSTPGKPYVFGGGSFGDELLQDANAVNVFHSDTTGQGYPQVTDEAVITANPQFIVLTEDPKFGGDAASVYKRPNWGTIVALKMNRVYNVNGDLMSRPGPRLVEGLRCVAQLVHPDKFSGALPTYCSAA